MSDCFHFSLSTGRCAEAGQRRRQQHDQQEAGEEQKQLRAGVGGVGGGVGEPAKVKVLVME